MNVPCLTFDNNHLSERDTLGLRQPKPRCVILLNIEYDFHILEYGSFYIDQAIFCQERYS